jgi:hypothetical protein
MSQVPNTGATRSAARPFPLWAAALLITTWWLPAILAATRLPGFVAIFDEMEATGLQMPALTRALMPLGRLGAGPLALIVLAFVLLLVAGYAGWVRAELPGHRVLIAGLLAALGIVAFFACVLATTLPVAAIRSQL